LAVPELSLSIDLKSRSVTVSLRHACLRASDVVGGQVSASESRRSDSFASVRRSTPRRTACIASNYRHRDSPTWSPCRSNGNSDTRAASSRVPMIPTVLVDHVSSDLQAFASMRSGGRSGPGLRKAIVPVYVQREKTGRVVCARPCRGFRPVGRRDPINRVSREWTRVHSGVVINGSVVGASNPGTAIRSSGARSNR
jgi:hypothetical protein